MEGFLLIYDNYKKWNSRYVHLNNSQEKALEIYKDDTLQDRTGRIVLNHNASISQAAGSLTGNHSTKLSNKIADTHRFVFTVTDENKRLIHFSAKSRDVMQQWITTIQNIISTVIMREKTTVTDDLWNRIGFTAAVTDSATAIIKSTSFLQSRRTTEDEFEITARVWMNINGKEKSRGWSVWRSVTSLQRIDTILREKYKVAMSNVEFPIAPQKGLVFHKTLHQVSKDEKVNQVNEYLKQLLAIPQVIQTERRNYSGIMQQLLEFHDNVIEFESSNHESSKSAYNHTKHQPHIHHHTHHKQQQHHHHSASIGMVDSSNTTTSIKSRIAKVGKQVFWDGMTTV